MPGTTLHGLTEVRISPVYVYGSALAYRRSRLSSTVASLRCASIAMSGVVSASIGASVAELTVVSVPSGRRTRVEVPSSAMISTMMKGSTCGVLSPAVGSHTKDMVVVRAGGQPMKIGA